MDRTIYAGSILIALVLLAGSIWMPDNAGMWLASTSTDMNIMRATLVGLLMVLLFTNPPRRREIRAFLLACGLSLLTWPLWQLWNGGTQVVDVLVFVEAGIALAIAGMEGGLQPLPLPTDLAETNNPAVRKLEPISDVQGLVILKPRLAQLTQQLFMPIAIVTGVLYQNMRPYRVVWRGG